MKFYNKQYDKELHPELQELLNFVRQERSFECADYLKKKTEVLNEYLRQADLKSLVVGISGGVDSALVLALAKEARLNNYSPIKNIYGLLMPCFGEGATNQKEALQRGKEVIDFFNAIPVELSFEDIQKEVKNLVDTATGFHGHSWAEGQLVSYLRTPLLYYTTSLLTEADQNGLVLGTTNLSEGGYLGYFGKASDGMVDLQVISDIYKSEVYQLSSYLEVPQSIIEVKPSGDMFDGRIDEEVFGASYDFVELYQEIKMHNIDLRGLSKNALKEYKELGDHLENLHQHNHHKYLGKSPAVHLDILPSKVPGGWNNE